MTNVLHGAHVKDMRDTYAAWSGIYDFIYRYFFAPAQKRAAALAAQTGVSVLEVGFGTGLTLSYYPKSVQLTGIDISLHMLELAKQKLKQPQKPDVKGLCVMDAGTLGFADAQFDAIVFPFVIALVPSYRKALDEAARVLKPGGRIVLANRFGAERGMQAFFEAIAAPLANAIGWSCNFKMSFLEDWANAHGGMKLSLKHQAYFSVMVFEKNGA